jgi:hypothetical protein
MAGRERLPALGRHAPLTPTGVPDTGTDPVEIVRHDLIMNQPPVPDSTLVEIVGKIFLPLVTG